MVRLVAVVGIEPTTDGAYETPALPTALHSLKLLLNYYAKGVIEELVAPILETANFLREVSKSDKAVNPSKMKSSWNKAIDNLGYQEAEKE